MSGPVPVHRLDEPTREAIRKLFRERGVQQAWITTDYEGADEACFVVSHEDAGDLDLDEPQWRSLGLDDVETYRHRDWTAEELRDVLPTPSVTIGRDTVWCFRPPSGNWEWAYFDFDGSSANNSLRSVRIPVDGETHDVVLTPCGQQLADHAAATSARWSDVDGSSS